MMCVYAFSTKMLLKIRKTSIECGAALNQPGKVKRTQDFSTIHTDSILKHLTESKSFVDLLYCFEFTNIIPKHC